MKNLLVRLLRDEEGQDLIEYGLLVGIITIGAVTAIVNIAPLVEEYYENLEEVLNTAPAGEP